MSCAATPLRKERVKVASIPSTAAALQSSLSSGRICRVYGKIHAIEPCCKLTYYSFNTCRGLLKSHALCYRLQVIVHRLRRVPNVFLCTIWEQGIW